MKSLPKIIIIFFLFVFILQLAGLLFLVLAPSPSRAANEINFKPQVIQDLGYTFNPAEKSTANIANLVRAIYKYAIGIVGILAAVVLMIGGVMWIVAAGNATAIGEAKAWIGASLTGLLLALTSYVILATVNPALVNLKTTGITQVEPKKPELESYTASSYPSVSQDSTLQCGNQKKGDSGEIICGTMCSDSTQSCQKTNVVDTPNAIKCPTNTNVLDSETGGDWWVCTNKGGAGSEYCNLKDGSGCQPGFVCSRTLLGIYAKTDQNGNELGTCTKLASVPEFGICGNTNECQVGQCVDIYGNGTKYCRVIGQTCGPTNNLGTCMIGKVICPSGKSHVWGGSDCPKDLVCCK